MHVEGILPSFVAANPPLKLLHFCRWGRGKKAEKAQRDAYPSTPRDLVDL